MSEFLYPYQKKAVEQMRNGCILNGSVGSGKTRTGLYYYFKEQHGTFYPSYKPMVNPKDLYIITTPKKRDSGEFEDELCSFLLSTNKTSNQHNNTVVIDSWNNIKKYVEVTNAFFIFDEDRVTGKGAWVKSFLKIARSNDWIILSATPGDTWEQYIPVFIANGFYKNRTEFNREHVVFSSYTNFPKIDRYLNTGRLIRLRDRILINMDFTNHTKVHNEDVWTEYNNIIYKDVLKNRWNPYKNAPIETSGELCLILRRIVNEDESKQIALLEIFEKHPKMIIFYNFNYERDILKSICYGPDVEIAEWNGYAHQKIPTSKSWIYLVQYNAGCEGWNCITTDTIVFFSQTYSYKTLVQASGRINRLNTPYINLYYYHMKSHSSIDLAISKALKEKKTFNERKFIQWT